MEVHGKYDITANVVKGEKSVWRGQCEEEGGGL
jgi:hypothetical protein